MPIADVFSIVPRVETRPGDDPRLNEWRDVHERIQRGFKGAKSSNLKGYTEYVRRAQARPEEPHSLPAICLWTLETLENGGNGSWLMPTDSYAVAYDGETQLESWRRVSADIDMRHVQIAVDILYGLPVEWAMQAYHDRNWYGVKERQDEAIRRDLRDPVNAAVNQMHEELTEQLHRNGVAHEDKEWRLNLANLRRALMAACLGDRGIKNRTTEYLGPDLQDKADRLHELLRMAIGERAHPVVVKAAFLGAVGLLMFETRDWSLLVERVGQTDWAVHNGWVGIAASEDEDGRIKLHYGQTVIYDVLKALRRGPVLRGPDIGRWGWR
jgi:hypothetical protein